MLLFVKTTVWKNLFGKEAEKLEHANDDERTYYIIEKEPLVNTFISVPKDKSSLNCANFTAGIVEAVLTNCGFVGPHLEKLMIMVNDGILFLALQSHRPLAQRHHVHGQVRGLCDRPRQADGGEINRVHLTLASFGFLFNSTKNRRSMAEYRA